MCARKLKCDDLVLLAIDQKDKNLSTVPNFKHPEKIAALDLSRNPIKNLEGLVTMEHLTSLLLDDTKLASFNGATPLPCLKSINFKHTPLAQNPYSKIMALVIYSSLEKVNSQRLSKNDIAFANLIRSKLYDFLVKGWIMTSSDPVRLFNTETRRRKAIYFDPPSITADETNESPRRTPKTVIVKIGGSPTRPISPKSPKATNDLSDVSSEKAEEEDQPVQEVNASDVSVVEEEDFKAEEDSIENNAADEDQKSESEPEPQPEPEKDDSEEEDVPPQKVTKDDNIKEVYYTTEEPAEEEEPVVAAEEPAKEEEEKKEEEVPEIEKKQEEITVSDDEGIPVGDDDEGIPVGDESDEGIPEEPKAEEIPVTVSEKKEDIPLSDDDGDGLPEGLEDVDDDGDDLPDDLLAQLNEEDIGDVNVDSGDDFLDEFTK